MKINLTEGPDILLAKNPAIYKFQVAEILDYFAQKAKLYLAFRHTSAPLNGQVLRIKFGDTTLEFTFTTGYLGSDWSILQPFADFSTMDEYMDYLRRAFEKVPLIDEKYLVERSGKYIGAGTSVYIVFTAREEGDFDINIVPGTTMSFVIADTTYQHETNPVSYKEQLKLINRLVIKKNEHHNPEIITVSDIICFPQVNEESNIGTFELSDIPAIASDYLKYEIPNQLETSFLYRYNHIFFSIRNYLANYAAIGVNDRENSTSYDDFEGQWIEEYVLAINGGLPLKDGDYVRHFERDSASSAPYSWWWKSLSSQRKFFTFQDRTKIITKRQPEWLSFYIRPRNTKTIIQLTIVCTNSAGSTTTVTKNIRESNVQKGLIAIATGYYQLNIPSMDADTIKYTVSIQGMSEEFTYIIDQRYSRYNRYLIFQNSLGCIETIRFTGATDTGFKKSSEVYRMLKTRNSDMSTGTFEMFQNELENTITLRSGWIMNREELAYYTEFIRSPYIGEILNPKYWSAEDSFPNIPEGIPSVPTIQKMILLSDSIEMLKELDFTYGIEFKLKLADNDISWSNVEHRPEPAYDTIIELQVKIGDNTQFLNWDGSTGYFKVYINNEYIDDIEYSFTKIGYHTVKIFAYGMTDLALTANNIGIRFISIDTFTLEQIQLSNFDLIYDRYLSRRVATLQNLTNLVIDSNGYTEIDELAKNLMILYDRYHLLTNIYVAGMPSVPVTQNAKEYFDSVGVTCHLF